jgi:hypothetical protein
MSGRISVEKEGALGSLIFDHERSPGLPDLTE